MVIDLWIPVLILVCNFSGLPPAYMHICVSLPCLILSICLSLDHVPGLRCVETSCLRYTFIPREKTTNELLWYHYDWLILHLLRLPYICCSSILTRPEVDSSNVFCVGWSYYWFLRFHIEQEHTCLTLVKTIYIPIQPILHISRCNIKPSFFYCQCFSFWYLIYVALEWWDYRSLEAAQLPSCLRRHV
jgi:hypothetical protein